MAQLLRSCLYNNTISPSKLCLRRPQDDDTTGLAADCTVRCSRAVLFVPKKQTQGLANALVHAIRDDRRVSHGAHGQTQGFLRTALLIIHPLQHPTITRDGDHLWPRSTPQPLPPPAG